jgi:hypothetical protein
LWIHVLSSFTRFFRVICLPIILTKFSPMFLQVFSFNSRLGQTTSSAPD